jgi:hypothetical protein
VKKDDRRDHPGLWNPDGLVRYLMLDSQVQGSRRLEGGFSLSEKAKAKLILSETNARYRKPKRRMTSVVLEKLKRSTPTPLGSERFIRVPGDLSSLVRKECVEGTEELAGRGALSGRFNADSPPSDRSVRAEARVGLSLAIEGPVRGLPSLGAAEIASVGQTRPHGGVLVGAEKVDDGLPHAGPVGRGLHSGPLQDIAGSFWATKGAAKVSLTPGLPAEPAKVTETKG